jgi:hypothetical protein
MNQKFVALMLFWVLDAHHHELTTLKIGDIRLRERQKRSV